MRSVWKHDQSGPCIRKDDGLLHKIHDAPAGKTTDPGREKHVPLVGKSAKGILVKLGAIPHPMEEKHYRE